MSYYTNGVDVITLLQSCEKGYLVRDKDKNTLLLDSLKGYSKIADQRSLKEWYSESKAYARKHPLLAILSALSVFFGWMEY